MLTEYDITIQVFFTTASEQKLEIWTSYRQHEQTNTRRIAMTVENWIKTAQNWLQYEAEKENIVPIQELISNGSPSDLQEFFGSGLQFGTAGLRGEMGYGPNRMNRTVVQRTSLGIANYLQTKNIKTPSVVIGYDARNNSTTFAEDTAKVFAQSGCRVYLFSYLVPTPLLSYATIQLGCDVGIMITASHNPPKDNGYKVYWSNGAQIIPPHDKGIAEQIAKLPAKPIVLQATLDSIMEVPEKISEGYRQAVQELRVHDTTGVKIVYTPLHGVGGEWIRQTLQRAGHTNFHVVSEQYEPNGNFPFAPFPNPEEKGSMDLAIELAEKIDADIIIANDPDADRLAVISKESNGLYQFTGDQIGLLLATDLLQHGDFGQTPLVATTVVSSSVLSDIANTYKASYAETLTGFKWIANKAIEYDNNMQNNGKFALGFEEALGYSIGDVARDKDGVSAALLISDLASKAKRDGQTLRDLLLQIYQQYGYSSSKQVSIKKTGSQGKKEIERILADLRDDPPVNFAGSEVEHFYDILAGKHINLSDGTSTEVELPKSNVLIFKLQNNERVIVRPSGTEPKIKFYFEVKRKLADVNQWQEIETKCLERIQELENFLFDLVT